MRAWPVLLAVVCVAAVVGAAPVSAGEEDEGLSLGTKYNVTLYGYIKLDAAYDDSRVNPGNFARWVEPEVDNDNDDQMNMTANQTRMGLKFDTADMHRVRTRGQVEIDFYGNGAAENKAEPMLRHAYLEMEWAKNDARLLAGQTSDLISPLNPPTVNYSVAWWAGNIGYRRPQIRFTKGFQGGNGWRSTVALALARNIAHDGLYDPGDTGEDAGRPAIQGRFGFTAPWGEEGKVAVGFSGHLGEEEWDYDADGSSHDLDSNSLNIDVKVVFNDQFTFMGEWFRGENLDAYLGGIAQGIVTPAGEKPHEVDSTGGWVSLSYKPLERLSFNFGSGVDDPEDAQLAPGARSKNRNYFGNTWWAITPATKAGLELSHWETRYKDMEKADAFRVQTSFVFSF